MASVTRGRCTCAAFWQGRGMHPECVLHEAQGHPDDVLPPGKARRRDGTVVDVLATIGARRTVREIPREDQVRDWRPWP